MKNILKIAAAFVSFAAFPALGQSLNYSDDHTASCLAVGKSLQQKKACIGVSANACMEDTPGGFSTAAMVGCLDHELGWWDKRLNAAYRMRMKQNKTDDAQSRADGISAPSKVKSMRAMQQTWIPYRDARCHDAAAQFGGGTGAGPAQVGCLLTMTAEQALFLETGPDM